MLHVYLGRFAPLHDGHKMLLAKLIKNFGLKNCLVLIGSVNEIDDRTPFLFETRKKMVTDSFPGIRVLALPNLNNDHDWLVSITKLEKKLGHKFVFYGGSLEDLAILAERFETHVLVDRFVEGMGISATEIRKTLTKTDLS